MSSRCSVNEVKTGKKGVQYASSICEFETLLQLGLVKLEPLQSLGLQDSFHSAQAPFATASTAVHQDVSEIVVDNAYFDVLLDLMVWSFCLLITLNLCEGKPLPKLATFAVEGHLSDGRTESVPFDPPFPTANRFDYKCYLDNIMNSFALKVDPEKFAILSRLLEDGKEVTTRSQLHHISIDEGAEKIFAVSLSSTHSQNVSKYTLQVLHRLGFSTSLEDLSFLTGHLKEAFHVQSEIQAYHAVQDVKEDFAEIQCVKEDGGQEITCAIEDAETRGDGRPSKAELTLFPHQYSPSLEKMHSLETWSRSTDRRARIQNCRIPIDTWRKVTVGLNITSADKTRHRHLQIIIDRDGCQNQSFFHDGRCILHCPIFHYEQRFNWRCGDCGSNCEFCAHFARCKRCRLDVPLKKYELQDGICEVVRVHPNKIYFFAAWYLGTLGFEVDTCMTPNDHESHMAG